GDGEDLALLLPLDEPPAQLARAVEGAVEHDLHDRVEGVRGQVLGKGEEVAGRVVDELTERSEVALAGVTGRPHGLRVADVAGSGGRRAGGGLDGSQRCR